MLSIPSEKGTYAIYIHLPRSKTITIGKLGRFNFPIGAYVYIGSAFGSGGLRSRLKRHIYGSTTIIGILISSVGMHKFVLFPISSTTKIMNASGFKHSQICPAHTSRSLDLDQATATNVMLIC